MCCAPTPPKIKTLHVHYTCVLRDDSDPQRSSVSSEHGAGYHGLGLFLGALNHQVDRARANEQKDPVKKEPGAPKIGPVGAFCWPLIVTLGNHEGGEGKSELNHS